MTDTIKTALWSVNLAHPVASMDDWAQLVETQIQSSGARVFVMPEYASEQWLHFAGRKIHPTEQLAWMAGHVADALPLLQDISRRNDVLLVSGTFAQRRPDLSPPFSNRAHVFFPDGRIIVQDKLCLTPKEKNPDGWNLSTGSDIQIFEYSGCRMAVIICLDIELPALSAKLAAEQIDMIMVPSMTKTLAGYHRVYDCAKARAVELQAAIAVCGAIAHAPARNPNISGASLFVPCEEAFGSTGTLASAPPVSKTADAGILLTADVPLAAIRAMRTGAGPDAAEVWPGQWDASHVKICRNP
jgi:predicted amidohydrolase